MRYLKIQIILILLFFSLLSNSFVASAETEINRKRSQTCLPSDYLDPQKTLQCPQSPISKLAENDKISKPEVLAIRRNLKEGAKGILGATSFENNFPDLKNAARLNHLDNTYLQSFIDQALKQIFSLKSLRDTNILCKVLPIQFEQFGLQFGITSRSLADSLFLECLKKNPYAIKSFFGNQIAMKEYIFIKSPVGFPFSGWTDTANTTYLFINDNTTWGDVVLAMIHELAIGMDSKMNLDYIRFLMQQGPGAYLIEDWQNLFKISTLPEISYAFSAMRANRIMHLAITEIVGQGTIEINQEDTLENEFTQLVHSMQAWHLRSSENSVAAAYKTGIVNQVRAAYPDINDAIKIIVNSKEQYSIANEEDEMDFLTFMAKPLIGSKSFDTMKANGPGCGYCGTSYSPEIIQTWNKKWETQFSPLINGVVNETK
jgi:hypothetical protein